MSEHTKGKWTTRTALGSGDVAIVDEDQKIIIAECFADIREPGENAASECLANARLVAAAPDMLDALKIALGKLKRSPEMLANMLPEERLRTRAFMTRLEEVIAKAEDRE